MVQINILMIVLHTKELLQIHVNSQRYKLFHSMNKQRNGVNVRVYDYSGSMASWILKMNSVSSNSLSKCAQ